MSFKTAATLASAFASAVFAHGTVTGIKVDGVYQPGYSLDSYYAAQQGQKIPDIAAWSAENLDNGFVAPADFGTSDIACHINAAPGHSSVSVKAGGSVDFQWSAWPESHIGPVLTYVAKCAGKCTEADPATLKWVKIDAAGLDGTWAAEDLIKKNNTWTTTVPETLAAGSYVFRHEIIALHGAGSKNGAQNYPQCFNIDITGDGTDNPEGTLTTELYTDSEPGILFDPYKGATKYEIPGPPMYGAGSSKPVVPSVPSNTTVPTFTPAPTPVTPTSLVTSATAAPTQGALEVTTSVAPIATMPASNDEPSVSDDLPETFTLDTFIDWLRNKAGPKKARRHARQF
ncbi:murein transglycosylase [Fusarium langsethiae]|uniref:lytic cellulose monooxygenase (C4-dehydrogenating) n=1 Tax=Fusarium langsethiae TaxID=179993 RepID=A0A0M9EPG7_FUSLA|nr:murein transglycosylase [Fusarium langsethiae]GKU08155.1 unnamed protein product [Fusarium langsethiae]GKU22167.1 unnamed protein product [Fusarium langsethiae]